MPHKYEQLYNQVKEHNGGLIKFINVLDKNNYDYELRDKLSSATCYIEIKYGHFRIYDRKKERLVRMDIPINHPLASTYEAFNGFVYNKSNRLLKQGNYVFVYFKKDDFETIIKEIYREK